MGLRKRRPLIVDTDPGLDDALALAVCAGSPELDWRAALAVGGNVPLARTFANLRALLALLGRPEVPAGRGLEPRRGLHAPEVHGGDGLGGYAARLPRTSSRAAAWSVLLRTALRAAPDASVEVLTLGPLTNLAAFLSRDGALLRQKVRRLTLMGGALFDAGNVAPQIEFNIACDPRAARAVLRSGVPQRWVPLDVTHRVTFGLAEARKLDRLRTPRARALAHFVRALVAFQDAIGPAPRSGFGAPFPQAGASGGHTFIHDALAACAILRPDFFTWRRLALETVEKGRAAGLWVADRRPTRRAAGLDWPVVEVALEVQSSAARSWILERILKSCT